MKECKEIKWILNPIWMPCMACKTEQSVNEVILDGTYHFVACESCAKLSEAELKDKLFRKAVVK